MIYMICSLALQRNDANSPTVASVHLAGMVADYVQ
jgi:hypothetical protein